MPYDPASPLLGIHTEEIRIEIHIPQCALQHYLQYLGPGSNLGFYWQRMDKEVVVNIHNGILLSYKKELI